MKRRGTTALRPTAEGWIFVSEYRGSFGWQHMRRGLRVLSSVDNLEGRGRFYHVSVSRAHAVPDGADMRAVSKAFKIPLAEVDLAYSEGLVHHIWAPVKK